MRRVTLLVAFLACAGHGRRLHSSINLDETDLVEDVTDSFPSPWSHSETHPYTNSAPDPLHALANVFFAQKFDAAFHPSGPAAAAAGFPAGTLSSAMRPAFAQPRTVSATSIRRGALRARLPQLGTKQVLTNETSVADSAGELERMGNSSDRSQAEASSTLTAPELLMKEATAAVDKVNEARFSAEAAAAANIKAGVDRVSEARSAAEASAAATLNATADGVVKTVSEARSAAEAGINATVTSIDATVKQVEKSQAEAFDKLAEVGSYPGGFLRFLPGGLTAQRSAVIWAFVVEMYGKISQAQRSDSRELKEQIGEELCEGLVRLGPTFIKLGQILSTRYDILDYTYVKALEKLQDGVPPFDGNLAYQIVVQELGKDAFREFNREPIAAASLGQVHLAVTKDGQQVAVKVQRPGLKELFEADLLNLRILADWMYKMDDTPDSMLRDWREIFESNSKIIYEEIDYLKEAKNGQKFTRLFEKFSYVKVPQVYDDLSTSRVLTMEFVPGIKISNVQEIKRQGFSPEVLARQVGECFMVQLLRHGFFHCDPHPGNLAVDGKGPGGSARIIFYDFGMVGVISEKLRKALVDGFFALFDADMQKSPKQITQALIDGEMLGGKVDRQGIDRVVGYFLESFRERLALDRSLPMTNEDRSKLRMKCMQDIGNELAACAADQPFRYPDALPYVLRAFNALEGVGKGLDPNYDVSRIAKKYIKNLIDLRDGNAWLTAWKKVQENLGLRPKDLLSVIKSPRNVNQVTEFINKLERGESQLRVRALELERAMVRSTYMQRASLYAIGACCALNVGTVLAAVPTAAVGFCRGLILRMSWLAVFFFGWRAFAALRSFHRLERAEAEQNLAEYVLERKRAGA